jgi:hypothetical protein
MSGPALFGLRLGSGLWHIRYLHPTQDIPETVCGKPGQDEPDWYKAFGPHGIRNGDRLCTNCVSILKTGRHSGWRNGELWRWFLEDLDLEEAGA